MTNILNIIYLILFSIVAWRLTIFLDTPIVHTSTCGIYESCSRDGGEFIIEEDRVICIKNKEK